MRRPLLLALLALLALLWAACGGDDGGGGDPESVTCAAGEIAASGTLDGVAVRLRSPWKSYGFVNAFGGNGSFDSDFTGDGTGALHLEWPELVSDGAQVDCRGTLEIERAAGGVAVGNCLMGADFPGSMTVDADGEGGRFVLEALAGMPYCGGAAVSGRLAGCFRNR